MDNGLPTDIASEIKALVADCATEKDLIQKMMTIDQADCPVTHTFVGDSYIRELSVKAGTFMVGHYQKTQHINMFVKGKVAMYNPDGSFKILTAPMYFIGEPGRKVGYIIEDMTWINIYSTKERDINKIESEFLDKSIESELNVPKIKLDYVADHISYRQFIDKLGMTESEVQDQVQKDNVIPLHGWYGFKLDDSDIHGQGVFATTDFQPGDVIGLMRIDDKRTILGRYTNHSVNPNARATRVPGTDDISLVATCLIKGCKGGQNGDEIVTDYEHNFNLSTGRIE